MAKNDEKIKKIELWKAIFTLIGSIVVLIGILFTVFSTTKDRVQDSEMDKLESEIKEVLEDSAIIDNKTEIKSDGRVTDRTVQRKNINLDTIKVLIPSGVINPEIWVGNQRIKVLKQTPTVIIILINKVYDYHLVELKSNSLVCRNPLVSEDNILSFTNTNCIDQN